MAAIDRAHQDQPHLLKSGWIGDVTRSVARQLTADSIVVLTGESGVGKDSAARVIHGACSRSNGPFVKVNCAMQPLANLESHLFGREKSAGSYQRRMLSQFEYAQQGIIFLDELDSLPRALAPQPLGVVRSGRVVRIGGKRPIAIDVRFLAATKRDLFGMRDDEFWTELKRLKLVEIRIPPLRERKDEIPALAAWFVSEFGQRYRCHAELTSEALALLTEYAWPGNVRELQNAIRQLVLTGDFRRLRQDIVSRIRHYKGDHAVA